MLKIKVLGSLMRMSHPEASRTNPDADGLIFPESNAAYSKGDTIEKNLKPALKDVKT